MQNTDSPAVVQTAQEKERAGLWLGFRHEQVWRQGATGHFGAQLGRDLQENPGREVQAGTWKTSDLWWGVKEGAVNIDNFGPAVAGHAVKNWPKSVVTPSRLASYTRLLAR